MSDFRREFLAFALAREVLRFGEFTTKAGRKTPYFFNAGLFNDGESLRRLGRFYAEALAGVRRRVRPAVRAGVQGHSPCRPRPRSPLPKKGTICRGASIARKRRTTARAAWWSGAPLAGRVLIVDDVITAGTSVRESVDLIRAHRANPAGVLIALDRMERGQGERVGGAGSAVARTGYRSWRSRRSTTSWDSWAIGQRSRREADAVRAYREQYGARRNG